MASSPLPPPLRTLAVHDLEGVSYFQTAETFTTLGIPKATFYNRIKELGITTRKIGPLAYIRVEDAVTVLGFTEYLSKGGNLQGWLERRQSLTVAAPSAIVPDSPDAVDVAGFMESLRVLQECSQQGYLLPTGVLARVLGIGRGSVLRWEKFHAYGFEFQRTRIKFKGEINWAVTRIDGTTAGYS